MSRQQVRNVDLATDVGRQNLLTNGGFEIWQRGSGPFSMTGAGAVTPTADRWFYQLAAGTGTLVVTKETSNIDVKSATSAKLVYTAGSGDGTCSFHQQVGSLVNDNTGFYKGTTVTFSIRVLCSAIGRVRIMWYDAATGGGTRQYGAFNTTTAWETLTLTIPISASATQLYTGIEILVGTSCTVYVDNAMLVVGTQQVDYVPQHPADDLNRCLRYYERLGGDDQGGNLMFRMYAGTVSQVGGFTLLYRAVKPVPSPTVSQVGTWSVGQMNPTLAMQGIRNGGVWVQSVATGTGDCWIYNGGAGSNIVVEANP